MLITYAVLGLCIAVLLTGLVIIQINTAGSIGMLTVEQLVAGAKKALSFDRHYAMPFDFAILPAFLGLGVFLHVKQWVRDDMLLCTGVTIVITLALVFAWSKFPGEEAHKDFVVGGVHGLYVVIGLWIALMVLVYTPKPEPVYLLVLCAVVPAFLFLGQHMYLGVINYYHEAATYEGNPLANIGGWAGLVVISGLVWWRSYVLIPSEFWTKFQ